MTRIANATEAERDAEIEVTPEMIEAGACELAGFHPDFESYEDAAVSIYKRMVTAKLQSQTSLD
jgi:hypothetical protein